MAEREVWQQRRAPWEPGSSSLLSGSTFGASCGGGAGFGSHGGACTVGVVERRLERAGQGDAVRNGAGLARSGRRLRLDGVR